MKKGKNVEKKKFFWKGKNTKVLFKKKSGEKSGHTSISTVEKSFRLKPKFQG